MAHVSVLLPEVIEFLGPRPGEFIIDGTLDGGGYAEEILQRIVPGGTLLGVDLDAEFTERFAERHQAESSCRVRQGNYADLVDILKAENLPPAEGLVLDLGFSSDQLESSGRGFSFLRDEPLLMTYDAARPPLRDVLRKLREDDLARIISEYGGERYAKRIAKAIVIRKARGNIRTSMELANIVRGAVPRGYERGRIDPATRTFQALRIHVNDELGNLNKVLRDLPKILKPGGRAVIVTFHSLEDRLVKQAFQSGARDGRYELLNKKPIEASGKEMRENPRSRSAKLRAIKLI